MKKTCFLIVCLLVCCSLSAVLYPAENKGDLEISDIENSYAREFMSFMERQGAINDFFKSYEIKNDDSSWSVLFWDDTDYSAILMEFDDVYCILARRAAIDLSDYSLLDILKSVNNSNLFSRNCGALSYFEIWGDLFYSLALLTMNSMSPSDLLAQLLEFKKYSEENFDDVKKEIVGN